MAQIVKELRVDVSQPNVFQAIVAKQHDSNSRFLKITLVDFGVKVEVPNTAKVTINANRPDGASESFKGEANNDGTITVPLAQWMLDIDGEVKCDVSVTNTEDNKRLTSTDFWLEVQKAANPNASIPLDPDGEILIIKPVTEINENSKDADYPSAKAVYDYGQNIVTDTQITATATGSAITVESSQAPLQNLKLYGKTTQNGTPTPDNPIELKSVGDSGSYSVEVYGRNLADTTRLTEANWVLGSDGYYSGLASDLHRAFYGSSFVEVNNLTENDIVTVKFNGYTKEASLVLKICYADGIVKSHWFGNRTPENLKFTSEKGKKVTAINLSYGVDGTGYLKDIQVEVNTDTPFEEYKGKQTLTLTDTLRGIGDIADEKDFARGVTTQRFGIVDLGTLNWKISGTSGFLANDLHPQTKAFSLEVKGNGLCDVYVIDTWNNVNQKRNDKTFSLHTTSILVYDTNYTDATTFKSAISGKYLIYELAEPIETPISESELNAYRQLHTNKPNTTILSEAEMKVDYYINKPNAQAIGNIHSQINKDYLKLQQAIISTGGSTL